jgi:predicted  nucleic acid-binding Zn-ribbon protein
MSYAPIYNKLHELEQRIALMESAPKTTDEGITISPLGLTTAGSADAAIAADVAVDTSAVAAVAAVADELKKVKADFDDLLKECSANSSAITQLSTDLASVAAKEEVDAATAATAVSTLDDLATKAEVATLATKDELATLATKDELATLATKDELATLATKAEVADLLVKFDNVINVISQLNAKINEAHEKLAEL